MGLVYLIIGIIYEVTFVITEDLFYGIMTVIVLLFQVERHITKAIEGKR